MEDCDTRFERAMVHFKKNKSRLKVYKINISDAARVWNVSQEELERNYGLTPWKPNTMVIAMPPCKNK